MLKRDIWDRLAKWKENEHHPLVLKGLRQTGKTFIVKSFGKQYYDHTVYLDFRADQSIHSAFEGDFDVDRMVMSISAAIPRASFVPKKTLIILTRYRIARMPEAL